MADTHIQLIDRDGKTFITSNNDNLFVKTATPSTFNIELYVLEGEKNRVNKTNFIRQVGTLSGALRESSSIVNMSLNVVSASVPTFNYAHISVFNRYYFVDNITSIRNGVWKIDMSCDVLFSYYNHILNQTGLIGRQETLYNVGLPNNITPLTYNKSYRVIKGTKANAGLPTWYGSKHYFEKDNTSRRYILKIMARAYHQTYWDIPPITTELKSIDSGVPLCMTERLFNQIKQIFYTSTDLFGQKSLIDYVTECYVLPIEPLIHIKDENGNIQYDSVQGLIYANNKTMTFMNFFEEPADHTSVKMCGNVYPSGINRKLDNGVSRTTVWKITIPSSYIKTGKEAYKNFSPYTNYTLQFQPFGTFPLDFNNFILDEDTGDYNVYIRVTVNALSGDGVLYYGKSQQIADNDIGTPYYLSKASVKINTPVLMSNVNYTSAVTSGMTGVAIGTKAGMSLGGPEGAGVGAVVGAVGGALLGGVIANNNPTSVIKDGAYAFIDDEPQLICERTEQVESNDSLFGLPYYQTATLQSLVGKGFTTIERIHLENIGSATSGEKDEIENLLKQGVIL